MIMKWRIVTVLSFVIFLIGEPAALYGQACSGNLGTNIFEEGDFGSGTDNILQQDPGIAPGYTYSTTRPEDGSYTITNSLAEWSSRFDWPAISSDNSSDPNGYMMVVNASFDAGVFYEQQIDNLCENTLYVFSADVFNIHPAGRNYIKPNVSFALNDVVEFETGDVPENGVWNTYGFTFITDPGVTSIKLSLINNAPGGVGNDLILDNIKFQACGPQALILPEAIADICEDGDPITLEATIIGDQYEDIFIKWQRSADEGITWQDIPGANTTSYQHTELNAGFYYYRYLLAGTENSLVNDKCRINSNVKVINVIPKFYSLRDTLCSGLTYILGQRSIGESGTFTDSLKNFIGCDSIVTLDLVIVEEPNIQIDFDIDNPSCTDFLDGSITVANVFRGHPPYDFYFEDTLLSNNESLFDLDDGSYSFGVIDRFGCTADTIIKLINPIPLEVDLGSSQIIAQGDSLFINVNANYSGVTYEWNVDGIDCLLDCEEIVLFPLESFELGVLATSENGCTDSDLINIQVDKLRPVYVPNVFSPDGDGVNDVFTVYGDERKIIQVEELEVYDRWANLLYELVNFQPNDLSTGWDGYYKGKPLNSGTYLYVAHVRFIDDEIIQYTGSVTIVR